MKRYWTPEQIDEMQRMYSDGYSCRDIGKHFNCCRDTIELIFKKLDVAKRRIGKECATPISIFKRSRERHYNWNGGRQVSHSSGYVRLLKPEHPSANKTDGTLSEHRYIMEQHLLLNDPSHPALENGILRKDWVVHHINHDRQDNRLDNLELMQRREHGALHGLDGAIKRWGIKR